MNEVAYQSAEARLWSSLGMEAPEERRVFLDRLSSFVRVMEVGRGSALLLVHGGPNAGSTWAPLVRHLDGYRCLLVDRPGCGLSPPPPAKPRSVRSFVTDMMNDLMDQLGRSLAGIVASSFGSYAVLTHAAATGSALPSVHFGCPALAPGSKVPLRFLLQSLPGFRRLLLTLEPPNVATARKAFAQIGHRVALERGVISDDHMRWYAALLEHTGTRENDLALFGQVRPRDRTTTDELAEIAASTSFFWGKDDTFGGEDVAQALVAVMPEATLTMVPDSGHLPWMDSPEEAAHHVGAFFGGPGR